MPKLTSVSATMAVAYPVFSQPPVLPETGFLRQRQVLIFVPVSKSTLWRRVQARTFPAPVKLSERVTVWRAEDVGRWIREPQDAAEVVVPRRRMSLRALMHFLFERAGFNRWSPAMEGKRNQGVLHKYLQEAAQDVWVKGLALGDRLYVPEPFSEMGHVDSARRRREKLAVLHPRDGHSPLAVVIGEFKTSDVTLLGRRVWIKHMPDAPLLISPKAWERIEREFAPLLEARDADTGHKPQLMVVALIRERREHTYEIDSASLMLTSEHWIPVEGIHELPLVHALVDQQRRFVKPLRYDTRTAAAFANALLLDAGAAPVPLHVVSAFMDPKEQAAKALALKTGDAKMWVWHTSNPMPTFPPCERP